VDIVDCGNHVSADVSGDIDGAIKTVKAMASAGYTHAVIGSHEFDFGLDGLKAMLDEGGLKSMSVNFRYSGFQEDITEGIVRYDIVSLGNVKIAYVAISDNSVTESKSDIFMEDGRMAYSFSARSNSYLNETVRKYADICRSEGADYVILISDYVKNELFNMTDMTRMTDNIDAVICANNVDGRSLETKIYNNNDKEVPLVFLKDGVNSFTELRISPSGSFSFTSR